MLLPKTEIIWNKKHLQWIASLPCCISGNRDVQAAHVKGGWYGMGIKNGDNNVVPLYWKLHDEQTRWNEPSFWAKYGHEVQDAKSLANSLYEVTGQRDKAIKLITEFRHAAK